MSKVNHLLRFLFLLFIGVFLLSCSKSDPPSNKNIHAFDDIYEPSGVLQLADGRILIVEDEKDHPFSLFQFENKQFKRLALHISLQTDHGKKAPALNDLEAITQDKAGWIYAITSHSRNSKAKRKQNREQLVRFRINKLQLKDYQIADSARLMDALTTILPKKKQLRQLNIEGLAYDPQQAHLLLGLRAPLLNDQAVLIRIKNPHTLFDHKSHAKPDLEKISLNLNGHSIRSIEYDPVLKGYLIVAGSVKNRGKKPFQLWLWKANKLHNINLSKANSIGYTEGITAFKDQKGQSALLLVQDDGQRGHASGHYRFLSYDQLKIQE